MFNKNSMDIIQKSLDAVWLRKKVIANNIANNDTPEYKSKYVIFEDLLKDALYKKSNSENLQNEILKIEPKIAENNTSARDDGNNVDIDAENIEMARTQLQYEYLIHVLNSQMNNLKYAINGGK